MVFDKKIFAALALVLTSCKPTPQTPLERQAMVEAVAAHPQRHRNIRITCDGYRSYAGPEAIAAAKAAITKSNSCEVTRGQIASSAYMEAYKRLLARHPQ